MVRKRQSSLLRTQKNKVYNNDINWQQDTPSIPTHIKITEGMLQNTPSSQARCAAHITYCCTHTHLHALCIALPRKPSCGSVCSSKLHPNTTTNYITHPSWLAMHHRNQPREEVAACHRGQLDVLHGAEQQTYSHSGS